MLGLVRSVAIPGMLSFGRSVAIPGMLGVGMSFPAAGILGAEVSFPAPWSLPFLGDKADPIDPSIERGRSLIFVDGQFCEIDGLDFMKGIPEGLV